MKKLKYNRKKMLERLAAMKDEDIDFSDIPEITDFSGFRPAREVFPEWFKPVKAQVTLRIDADILAWFKARAPKYQTALNAALREYVTAHQKAGKRRKKRPSA